MKYILFFLLLAAADVRSGFSQVTYSISSFNTTPPAFRYLLLTNQQIEENDTINEEIIDLVEPMVLDSVLDRRKEHHQLLPLGWFISTFGGFNWRAVNMTKEKFVGTIKRDARSGAEEYTEYDINFDLYFHLDRYLQRVFASYDLQRRIHRQDIRHSHRTDYSVPPYTRDTLHIDMGQYRLHCELTPQREFRPQLHYLFYPTQPGLGLAEHPNFMNRLPSMGFYGASCLDCNHNCHPELHPYEWIWWMNLHNETASDKTWLIGILKDGSNRFHHWSHNPKTGKTRIPFAFHVGDKGSKGRIISVEPLVFNTFRDAELSKLNLPSNLIDPSRKYMLVSLTDGKGLEIPVVLQFKPTIITNGLKYWFSDVNWDEQNHILSGYFNMAVSVMDLYTMKLTFSEE